MTTPIKPMSAEEIIESLDEWLESNDHKYSCASWGEGLLCCLDKAREGETNPLYGCKGRDFIRQALASHLAYVKEKAQKVADDNPEYYNAYAHGFDDCLAVLQSEIDELTK